MNKVLLCNHVDRLKIELRKVSGPLSYIRLTDTDEGKRICQYLNNLPDAREIPRGQQFRENNQTFRHEYVEFMSQLNVNNCSLHWWAMPFTNKNPLATHLYREVFYVLLIVRLARTDPRQLVVITDNIRIAAQVDRLKQEVGIAVTNAVSRGWNWKEVAKDFTPAGVLFALLKAFRIWRESRRFRLDHRLGVGLNVISSILHPQALAEPDHYRDVYFGGLVEYLLQQSVPTIIFGLLDQGWNSQLARLRNSRFQLPVIPVETYVGLKELLGCGLMALKHFFFPSTFRGPTSIDGVDLSYLIKQSIHDATHSGNFLQALLIFNASKCLATHTQVVRCFYPYENRTWEKMLILGIRAVSPDSRLIGYQHSSITPSHTNFLLGNSEAQVTPLPNSLVTTGPFISKWLEKNGNYPSGLIKTGCALRQGTRDQAGQKPRKPQIQNVLMALATSVEEYVNALVFLEKSFENIQRYCLRIRPHPTIPLGPSLALTPLTRRDFFSSSSGDLSDALDWADVVLYASSTVGLESVSLGIPVVHLDLGDFLESDPFLEWDELRWSISEPSKLINTLKSIEAIPDAMFRELQRRGKLYSASYLSPVTPTALRIFCETSET